MAGAFSQIAGALGGTLSSGFSTIVFFLTRECGARCPFCFNTKKTLPGAAQGGLLTVEEYSKLAANLRGLRQAIFSGGEPFLRKDISEIASALRREAGVRLFSIPTNGMAEGALESVERMARENPGADFNIQVSIDAVGERHDRLRGPGCFKKAVALGRGLLGLQERIANVTFIVGSTVTAETIDDAEPLEEFLLKEYGGRLLYHNIQLDQRLGSCLLADESLREKARPLGSGAGRGGGIFAALIRRLYQRAINRVIIDQAAAGKMLYACLAGRKLAVVLPDGRMAPCEPFVFESRYDRFKPVGLREHGLDPARAMDTDAWRGMLRSIDSRECDACPWSCGTIRSLLDSPAGWPFLLGFGGGR